MDITSQTDPPNDFRALKTSYRTQLSYGSVSAAIASKNMTDAQARATVGGAASLVAGLQAIGLSVFDDTGNN